MHWILRLEVRTRPFRRWLSPGVEFAPASYDRSCARCRYPFPGGALGTPAPCSECGAWIDPADASTVRWAQPSPVVRWCLHAPGAFFIALVGACCGVVLVALSVPVGYLVPMLLGGLGLLVLGVLAAARAALALAIARYHRRIRSMLAQAGWWLAPGLVALMVLALLIDLPLRAGGLWRANTLLATQRAWQECTLADLPADFGGLVREGDCIGQPDCAPLLRFGPKSAFCSPPPGAPEPPDEAFAGVLLRVPRTGFMFDQGAYAYLPKLPPDLRRVNMVHLFGDWYAVRIHFN